MEIKKLYDESGTQFYPEMKAQKLLWSDGGGRT